MLTPVLTHCMLSCLLKVQEGLSLAKSTPGHGTLMTQGLLRSQSKNYFKSENNSEDELEGIM